MTGFLVSNPGAVAEMSYAAAGLANHGLLDAYYAPFGASRGAPGSTAPAWLPSNIRKRIDVELARRHLPEELSSEHVRHVGRTLEIVSVAASRLRPPFLVKSSVRLRNARFDQVIA